MISKNKIKEIRSLERKKYRRTLGLFVAEGPKVVSDLLQSMTARTLVHTASWQPPHTTAECCEVSADELRRVSFLQHPQEVLGVFELPAEDEAPLPPAADLCLALDGVQDPGNLGTIIRIADWFGVEHVYLSPDTADAYNPKVVQATMGSLARVRLHRTDLPALLDRLPEDYPLYGTLLEGRDLYGEMLSARGMIVMGSEGQGISQALRNHIDRPLRIPSYASGVQGSPDSLNVAVATAVVLAEFRRRAG